MRGRQHAPQSSRVRLDGHLAGRHVVAGTGVALEGDRARRRARMAKPKHDLVAVGTEIGNTNHFVVVGRITDLPEGLPVPEGRPRALPALPQAQDQQDRASSGPAIFQYKHYRTCFKVGARRRPRHYAQTVIPVGCIVTGTVSTPARRRPHAPARWCGPFGTPYRTTQTTVQVSPPPIRAASRSVGVAGDGLAGGGDLGARLVVVRRPLDLAEDADRRLVEVAGVGQPGDRERRRRVRVVRVVDEQRVVADVGDVDDLDAAGRRGGPGPWCPGRPRRGAEPDRLAVHERDDRVGLGVGVLDRVEGAVVEDRAVLVDLDQRGAAVGGGRGRAPR